MKRSQSRDSSPELFSDPAECEDGIADSGGSREHAESGMNSNNATNAWFVCLVCVPGLCTWFVCLVCVPGLCTWFVCLVCVPGYLFVCLV